VPQANKVLDNMLPSVSDRDDVASLGARAELVCATAELCEAYGGVLREHYESGEGGAPMDRAARTRLVGARCAAEYRAFVAAWQRGSSAIENMREIEIAVQGYADRFDLDENTKAGVE
jgi:hypothetical protein